MNRRLCALAIAPVLAILGATPAHANFSSCTYDASTKVVTATLAANNDGRIGKDSGVIIRANDSACGAATVNNTDLIRILVPDDSGDEYIQLDLRQGALAPGLTDEPGNSDEIEVEIEPGEAGFSDVVEVLGSPGPDRYTSSVADDYSETLFNLNAGETEGIDADVTVSDSIEQHLIGNNGADVLRGYGGDGLPSGGVDTTLVGGDSAANLSGSRIQPGPGNDLLRFTSSFTLVSFPSASTTVSIFTQEAAPGSPAAARWSTVTATARRTPTPAVAPSSSAPSGRTSSPAAEDGTACRATPATT